MSRPCGQPRAFVSRRGRQGKTVLPRIRRAWTGPNDGAVRGANTHGCAVIESGVPLAPRRPRANELPRIAPVDGRAGRAHRLAAVPTGRDCSAVEGGEFAGGHVDHVGAVAELDRVGGAAVGGELAFPAPEVSAGAVVGVRPRFRARDEGSGTGSGC